MKVVREKKSVNDGRRKKGKEEEKKIKFEKKNLTFSSSASEVQWGPYYNILNSINYLVISLHCTEFRMS